MSTARSTAAVTGARLRPWAPDLALAGAVLVVGLVEASRARPFWQDWWDLALVVAGIATAVGLSRRAPGAAVGLVWVVGLLQLASDTPVLLVQASVAAVLFGAARWGSPAVVLLSGLSIPLGAAAVVLLGASEVYDALAAFFDYSSVVDSAYRFGTSWQVAAGVLGMLALGSPWLAGLVMRFVFRAEQSRVSQVAAEEDAARAVQESEQAREIARLREEQARMARDVHDVVGHSLAVILAQAESAQYVPDADTEKLKQTMATIATSARTSLQDVRQVLTTTQASTASGRTGGLDSLVDGVRSSGHEVVSTVVGQPRPLPPELETVAYRVLQEMLTNAIKHGRRDAPVSVERHWEGELRLEVRNVVAVPDDATQPMRAVVEAVPAPVAAPGRGIDGMRRRLEAVGGRLDVRRREEAGGPTFTATAWVPLRGGA